MLRTCTRGTGFELPIRFQRLVEDEGHYLIEVKYDFDYDFHAMYDQSEIEFITLRCAVDSKDVEIDYWSSEPHDE